jgi:outer membrane assembly lipoprotein YfiO
MPSLFRVLIPSITLFLVLLSAGCSEKLSRKTGLTDAGLLARGQQKAEQKKYGDAAEAFQVLIERFPTSPLAPRAHFALAANRMANKEDVEAEVAFDDFLRLYPSDPKVPDALFLKGGLLSRQVLAPGRNQAKTHDAIDTYKRFLEKEQGTARAAEASGRIKELRNRLALHEETVVSHFLSRKLYESAESRARRALAEYPDVPATPKLLSLLARALEKQGKKEEASGILKNLGERYPTQGGGKR